MRNDDPRSGTRRPDPGNLIDVDGVVYVARRFLEDNPEHAKPDPDMPPLTARFDGPASDRRSVIVIDGWDYIAAALLPFDLEGERPPTFIPRSALPSVELHRRRLAGRSIGVDPRSESRVPVVAEITGGITADAFYEGFVERHLPCVIRGGARHWPAIQRWSDAYLESMAGNAWIKRTRSIQPGLDFAHDSPMDVVRFGDFLAEYRDAPWCYINDSDVPEPLRADIGTHAAYEAFDRLEDHCNRTGMFMGRGGQRAPLHYDDEENLYTVLAGRKRFTLYDVTDFGRLYPQNNRVAPDFLAVDPDAVDHQRFPLFAGARSCSVDLEAGDILYVPGYWWHAVSSVGRSLAVSYTRNDRDAQLRAYCKLVRARALPIDADHQRRLETVLDGPGTAIRRLEERFDLVELGQHDLFTLYLELGLLHRDLQRRGAPVDALLEAFDALHDPVVERLRDAEWGYPALYLMQNLYRVETDIFMV